MCIDTTLSRRGDDVTVTIKRRSAPALKPFAMRLTPKGFSSGDCSERSLDKREVKATTTWERSVQIFVTEPVQFIVAPYTRPEQQESR